MITFTITNKHRPKATVVMLVSLYGKQYRKSIGVGVPMKYWSDTKKRARVTADFKKGNEINDRIDAWREIGQKAVKHFEAVKQSPTQEEFSKVLTELSATPDDRAPRVAQHFCDYFEHTYIPRYKSVRGPDTLKVYNTTLNKLREFEATKKRHLRFSDINIDFYNDFQSWFYAQGFSRNYFGNLVKVIKQIYREARVYDELHNSYGTDHRDFIAPKDTADSVYLNTEELDRIYTLQLTEETVQEQDNRLAPDCLRRKIAALERARGLFLIGCYTGLRVSDFSRLRDAHIGKYISIKTSKTGTPVIIPIHPVVRAIIESGFNLSDTVSDQKLNGQIKELCRLAGITDEILVNKNEGGKNIEKTFPKYRLVSSHTARRSFATNAYKAGVPTIAIMRTTGHTKESTFLKYIKVSASENAEMLSNHPFFKAASEQETETDNSGK